MAGDAVDRNHLALAAERFGEPLGARGTPGGLVDADIDGIGRRDFRVGGDHQDAGFLRLGEDRIEGGRAVGVDDDGVHPFRDEVADMRDLPGHVDIGALDGDFDVDAFFLPFRSGGLRLVDHLGAPLAADPAVGETYFKGLGVSGCRQDDGRDGAQRKCDKFLHKILPNLAGT